MSQQQANQVQKGFFKRHKLSSRHRIEGSKRRTQGLYLGIRTTLTWDSFKYASLSRTKRKHFGK